MARMTGCGFKTFADMFQQSNIEKTLEFFIASFSRDRDDLGQWRAYADDGRGFAIGFSPRLFKVLDEPVEGRLPKFQGRSFTKLMRSLLATARR